MKHKDNLSYHKSGLSLSRYFLILIFNISIFQLTGQLNLDFNSGNINNTKWEGNISNFIINATGQLQLSTTGAGESSIFTKYKIPEDSIQVDLYFKLQFAPSNDNYGKIYLLTDNLDETKSNGYYLRLGENGSNDAIQVWKLTQGTPVLLGSGQMGGISADPADARVRIKIYRDGLWLIATDYEGKTIYEDDLEFSDLPSFSLTDSTFFGIYCKYTSTRADKFFYDDITIKTVEKDIIAPELLSIEVQDDNTLKLLFSEALEELSAIKKENYFANNNLGNPDVVLFSRQMPTIVTLKYNSKNIESGIAYSLTIKEIKDKAGNQKPQSLPFVYTSKPQPGDLILTEILTNPYSGGEDFIEIYNPTTKFIKLDSLLVVNAQKNETKVIRTSQILYPGKYIAISKNTAFLQSKYETPDTAAFIEAILPSLNVDAANITLVSINNGFQITIDSFDYRESYHFELIDDTKGISLERINLKAPTNDRNNWHSASSQVNYGTPGYKNSNLQNTSTNNIDNNILVPDKKVFSPDGDSVDDFILLHYKLDKPGYLASIKIFDAEGFEINVLVNNYLLSTEGSIKWDGVDNEGNTLKMGMYIVYSQIFHPDGDTKESRHVVAVSQKF